MPARDLLAGVTQCGRGLSPGLPSATSPVPVPDPTRVAASRLDPATSLQVFRAVLDSLTRPGRPTRLPIVRPGVVPTPLLPVLALADLEVVVAVLDHDPAPAGTLLTDWSSIISTATGARPAPSLHEADLVLALRTPDPAEIGSLRTGDTLTPERGTRLIVACERVGHGRTNVELTGPGAATGRILRLDGPAPEVFEAIELANRDFPAGLDTWFVAPDGATAAIPRSSRIEHVSVTGPDIIPTADGGIDVPTATCVNGVNGANPGTHAPEVD